MNGGGRIPTALLVASLGPLIFLYAYVVFWLTGNRGFLPVGSIELAVFVTQIARGGVVLTVPRFRRASLGASWFAFAVDLLVAGVLVCSWLFTRDGYLLSASVQLYGAWTPAFLIAFLPLALYKLASKMRDGRSSISETLPFLSSVFLVLAVLVSATYSPLPSSSGLSGFSQLLFEATFPAQLATSSPIPLAASGTVLAVAMVVYGVSQGAESPVMRNLLLALAVVGVAAGVGWGLAFASFTQSGTLVFTVPALGILAAIWGVSRGR